jgi:hypothetical protein
MSVKRHKAAIIGCQATNKSGDPCAAPPVRDSHYCSIHLVPGRAAELGKRGGQQNRSTPDQDSSEPIAIPETASDVKHLLARAIALTFTGQMSPRVAATLSYVSMAFLRVVEATDFDRRLKEVEEVSRRADDVDRTPIQLPEPTPEECDRAVEASYSRSSSSGSAGEDQILEE